MLKNARLFVNLVFLFSAILTTALPAEEEPPPPLGIELFSEEATIAPEEPFWIALRISLSDHWHTYWKNPGTTGFPFDIQWHLPEGFKVETVEWPAPKLLTAEAGAAYVYEKKATLLAKITPPAQLQSPAKIHAEIKWLACSEDNCLPGLSEVDLSIPVDKKSQIDIGTYAIFSEARSQIPQSLALNVAQRQDGYISLLLPLSLDSTAFNAAFFSENSLIDTQFTPLLIKEQDDKLKLLLKESTEGEETSDLNGVLVFTEKESLKAPVIYAIKTAIDSKSESLAALSASFSPDHQETFIWILAMAFIGGLILNLMPCVLPVISLKILSFVKFTGQKRMDTLKHGLSFCAGVLFSFWVLAAALLSLQAYGQSVGWGFQLQEPLFVGGLAALLLIFGLSMLGLFELGSMFAAKAGQAQFVIKKESNWSAFFGGVLATAVATPCTGPFLGTAVGVAVTMPAVQAMSVFTALGLGMASPYLIFSAFPNLLRFLPKPGQWMVVFKEITGFVMLVTVMWLAWVFGSQTDVEALTMLFLAFLILAFGCWILGKWNIPIKKRVTRRLSLTAAAACFAIGGYLLTQASAPSPAVIENNAASEGSKNGWEKYSPERVAKLQAEGTPVFIDFTAKWCLICQANHLVLTTADLERKFTELGIVKMKADWTKGDPQITERLRQFGRSGVPLYVLYGPKAGKAPTLLSQVLTQEGVLDTLSQLELEIAEAKGL